MTVFSNISLSICILSLILSLLILRYAKEKAHYLGAFLSLFVVVWAFWTTFRVGESASWREAIINWRFSYSAAIFIPVFYYHLVCEFCKIKNTKVLPILYALVVVFIPFILYSEHFISSHYSVFHNIYYYIASFTFTLWLIVWMSITLFSSCVLYRYMKKIDDKLRKMKSLFLFCGMVAGVIGILSSVIPAYGFDFYPIFHLSICLYVVVLTYVIIRHNFLKVRLILRSLIIPIFVSGILAIIFTYIFLDLTLFALTSVSLGIACLMLAFLVFVYSKHALHKIWSFFNLAVFLWAMGTFFASISKFPSHAEIAWRWAYGFGPFVPIVFYHFVYTFCELRKRNTLRLVYLIGIVFIPINFFAPNFITEVNYLFDSIYYHKATPLFTAFMSYLGVVVILSFYELIQYLKVAKAGKRTQALYILCGFGLGWGGGITTFLPPYDILVYPAWNFTICLYTIIMTYAILKYQIMDIKIAGTRIGIFLLVYSLVLGIPFFVGVKFGSWEHATWLMLFLATLGPFIYMFIQKKAEEKILQEQRSYQATLRKASLGMGRVKDLKRLLGLIVHVVTRTVKIEHCAIYLYHQESNQYILKASKGLNNADNVQSIIASNSPLVSYLKNNNEVLDYEIVKQQSTDFKDTKLTSIESMIKRLNGSLVIPSFIEERLLAVIVLGKKKSGKSYSQDDMVVFSILANQSALAIENAQFYEDMKKTHKQLFEAEKMATIGTMADGLSHQINNRLHAMGFIAGDAIDTLTMKEGKYRSKEARELSAEMKDALLKIEDNVKRGGEIVGGLLKYTRKGIEGFESIQFDKLLSASIEMVGLKVKLSEFDIVRNYNRKLPKINGNFTQLQEVFFNIIDNAYDAMRQRKLELKEEGYRGELTFTVQKLTKNLEIVIQDNGIGVKARDRAKLFTPFFTTKHSKMKKGTGLGLYVIRQLIERNHNGKVEFTGEYKKGATTRILLPLA